MQENDKRLTDILRAADKHPNSNVSKLIRQFRSDPTAKNIVMLLIELAENADFSVDFDVSLGYYLDYYCDILKRQPIGFNDTGVFLHNSARIYGRRVDCNYDYVNGQIQSFSKEDDVKGNDQNDSADLARANQRRGRKRLTPSAPHPYDLELSTKKIRPLSREKRFQPAECVKKAKFLFQHIMESDHLHPAQWQHSRLCDFDNTDETDSKRNYKLFTHHLEHRYNTLVPDINFRLHYKVKDYLHEAEERDGETNNIWSQDSNRFTDTYLRLENRIFNEELAKGTGSRESDAVESVENDYDTDALTPESEGLPTSNSDMQCNMDSGYSSCSPTQSSIESQLATEKLHNTSELNDTADDSGCLNASTGSNDTENISMVINKDSSNEGYTNMNSTALGDGQLSESLTSPDVSEIVDSALDPSAVENCSTSTGTTDEIAIGSNAIQEGSNTPVELVQADVDTGDLESITVNLQPYYEDNVKFSALSAERKLMLSPKVLITDVFPHIPNKENLLLIVDEEIMAMNDLPEPESFMMEAPIPSVTKVPLKLNIFNIDEKLLRRRALFKLGPEFNLYMEQRHKRTRNPTEVQKRQFKAPQMPAAECKDTTTVSEFQNPIDWFATIATNRNNVLTFDGYSSQDEFNGFEETDYDSNTEETCDSVGDAQSKLVRLSKDSGISDDELQNTTTEKTAANVEEDSGNGTNTINADALSVCESIEEVRAGMEASMTSAVGLEDPEDCLDNEALEPVLVDEDNSQSEARPELSNMLGMFPSRDTQHEDDPPVGFLRDGEREGQEKIRKWHEKLQPILAKSQERNHFNIYDLGTDVMDTFKQDDGNSGPVSGTSKIKFHNVMEQREKLDVSRYLLAVLVLVNQGNLSIKKVDRPADQPSRWEDIQLGLLKTARHKVDIADDIGRVSTTTNVNAKAPSTAVKRKNEQTPTKNTPSAYRASIDDDDDEDSETFSPPTTPCDKSAGRYPFHKRSRNVSNKIYEVKSSQPPQTLPTSTPHGRNKTVSCDLSAIKPIRKIEQQPRSDDDMDSGVCSNMD